jgi:RNA polymerase sigma factor (sigma-70 family)
VAPGTTVVQVDDRGIVFALAAGEPRGLDAAYWAYADRLFTYCGGLLGDLEQAADAVHDTFVLASQRAGELPDPERFRAFLYAIARNECLRVLRGRDRKAPPVRPDKAVVDAVDANTGLRSAEIHELVWLAAEGLKPADRAIFELAVRHELTPSEVGEVLGMPAERAQRRLVRARARVERALGVLLVARAARPDCPRLAALLAGWDGLRLSARGRRRVRRHAASCQICQEHERGLVSPTSLFALYATAPFLPPPGGLWVRLQDTSLDPAIPSDREAILARAGEFDPDTGLPQPLEPLDRPRRSARVAAIAGVAVASLLAAAAGTLLIPENIPGAPPRDQVQPGPTVVFDPPFPSAAAPESAPASAPAATGTAGEAGPGPAVPLPPSGVPPPRSSAVPPPASPPEPLGALTIEAAAVEPRCDVDGGYQLAATVTASRSLATATLLVTARGATEPYPMAVDGPTGSVVTDRMTSNGLAWRVEVTDPGGAAASTASTRIPRPCD